MSRAGLQLENIALRQQVAVLKRERPQPFLRPLDRVFWAYLSRLWPLWKDALVIVKLETVIGPTIWLPYFSPDGGMVIAQIALIEQFRIHLSQIDATKSSNLASAAEGWGEHPSQWTGLNSPGHGSAKYQPPVDRARPQTAGGGSRLDHSVRSETRWSCPCRPANFHRNQPHRVRRPYR